MEEFDIYLENFITGTGRNFRPQEVEELRSAWQAEPKRWHEITKITGISQGERECPISRSSTVTNMLHDTAIEQSQQTGRSVEKILVQLEPLRNQVPMDWWEGNLGERQSEALKTLLNKG